MSLTGLLTDADHIRGLLGSYCHLIDAGDFAGIGVLMADAVLQTEDGTALATGAEEVAVLFTSLVQIKDDGTPGTQHVVANTVLAEVGDGSVTAHSSYVVFQATSELPLQPVVTGTYRDTFDRDAAGHWRFRERRFGIGRAGDLTQHLTTGVNP